MQSHSAEEPTSTILDYLYSFFNKTPPVADIELKETKKKPRARKDFSDNVTASLALPNSPKRLYEEKKIEPPKSLSATLLSDPNLMAWLAPVYSHFGKTPIAAVEEKKDVAPVESKEEKKPDAEPVNEIMAALESEMQIHRKAMDTLEKELKELKKPAAPIDKSIEKKLTKADKLKKKEANQQKKAAKQAILKKQQEITAEIDALLVQKIDLVGDQIKEHAARRVDLFFYLLVAVYGKQVKIEKSRTDKQHGKGSKKFGTQACHSSLFPAVKMTNLPRGCSFEVPDTEPTIGGTRFDDTLNSTVELPQIVNVFDHHLEWIEVAQYKCKPSDHVFECLDILNQAAKGKIDPIEGMNQFLKIMNHFFHAFETEHLNKQKGPHQAMKLVYEYEKEGTLNAANKDLTINLDYIYMMLRLKPDLKHKAQWVPGYFQSYFLKDAYKEIQEEILTQKPRRLGKR